MRTAEEWLGYDVGEPLTERDSWLTLIRAIQQDAYRAGVEDAAKVIEEQMSGLWPATYAAKIRALKETT